MILNPRNVKIDPSWKKVLKEEFQAPYFDDIKKHLLEAEQNGKLAGMLSDLGTYSFQKTKNINTFEGGMICIPKNSKLDAPKIRAICNQGQTSKYHH